MRIIGTAGHVDHGKSSLVLALTGTDPDRFEEEKRRGLTIDLGFAHTTLPSGAPISIVDVPGHVRFLANMLAGVGAIDACLFVVAATEGWKPQSEEHLRILELLGIDRGVVALTKADLVDGDELQLAEVDVADHLSGSFLAGAAVVAVSSTSGSGLDDLRLALDALVAATPAAGDRRRPRLWIDRVFTARGSGTIVTGTLTDGSLRRDLQVTIEPGGHQGRIRAVQTLGETVEEVGPGNRVALNLSGVDREQLGRGDAVVEPGRWRPSDRVDASLQVLAALDHNVSPRGAYVAHIGSGEFPVRVRVLGDEAIAPGAAGVVRLHLRRALPLLPGDRYVLRESGRGETVGGGEILDVAPILPASKARPDRSIERVVAERGWIDAAELEAITGERRQPTIGAWVATAEAVQSLSEALRERVAGAGALGLDIASLDERERALLPALTDLTVDQARVRPVLAHDGVAEHPFLAELAAAGFTPPDPTGLGRDERRELVRRGFVVDRDGLLFHADTIDAAALVAARLLAEHPAGFTVSQFRVAIGATRKHALPLAAELDARGVTHRRGDLRVGGPKLPAI